MVSSHITIPVVFQTGFLESSGNTVLIGNIMSSMEMLEICNLFELMEMECASHKFGM